MHNQNIKNLFNKNSGYLSFVGAGFMDPSNYIEVVSTENSIKRAIFFGLSNITLGLFLEIILKVTLTNLWTLFFPFVSEMLFPVLIILFFLISYGVLFYILAKIFGGKGSLKKSIIVTFFSTPPIIFAFLPILQTAAILYWIFLLVTGFKKIHKYSKTKAVVNIIIPICGLLLALFALGLINLKNIF